MSRINCVRSMIRTCSSRSRFRCWDGESSWSTITRSASAEATAPCSSSSFPLPISVAGSGRSRRCKISPATLAPALRVSSRNSSSASSGATCECTSATGAADAASRAIFALGGMGASLLCFGGLLKRRLVNSTPTRKARSSFAAVEEPRFRCPSYADISELSSLSCLRRAILTLRRARLRHRRSRRNWLHVRMTQLATVRGPRQHDRRDRVFEDQLLLVVRVQDDRVLVKRTNPAGQLHPAQKIDRYDCLVFAGRVEKGILDILCGLVFHICLP